MPYIRCLTSPYILFIHQNMYVCCYCVCVWACVNKVHGVYVCMYVCVCACMCVCMRARVYVRVCVSAVTHPEICHEASLQVAVLHVLAEVFVRQHLLIRLYFTTVTETTCHYT